MLQRIEGILETDFLAAETTFAASGNRGLVTREEFEELRATFVGRWFDGVPELDVDDDQAGAIAGAGHVQVVARAGSGKTRTIVARSVFLQKHCGVRPEEILLLAFNKKAAELMKVRLVKSLGETLPHVMTFHALAHALIHPEEEIVYDDSSADQLGLSREVQEVIDEHLTSPIHRDQVRDLMLARFRGDWERVVEGRFELTMNEFLAYRRSLQRESLNGDYVKSFGELVIANALFEHGVSYRYERNVHWNGTNYRPDFTILEPRRVVIEYFGMRGDPDYDELSVQKRRFWSMKEDYAFMEFAPRDLKELGTDAFVGQLLERLRDLGVPVARRSEEEIWQLVKRRAVDGFTGALKGFVSRCRKLNLDGGALRQLVADYTPASAPESMFLEVGESVYEGYLERLRITQREDFDGLIWRAVDAVQHGQTHFVRAKGQERGDLARLRFIMIDEYQDFSRGFDELVEGARKANEDIELFCVGDDWQAINGFAGSELRFFNSFVRRHRGSSLRYLRTNYRSTGSIVEAGNALMRGHGVPARAHRVAKGDVWLARLDELQPSPGERDRHEGDDITPGVLRIAWNYLRQGKRVLLLSRTNSVPWYVDYPPARRHRRGLDEFVEHIRSFLPEEDRDLVTASTVHRYKGLEQQAVVVLDALESRFPLIHPNWIFLRIFGDGVAEIAQEERRLLYVAITRAEDSLVLITDSSRTSPFVNQIEGAGALPTLDWSQLVPAPSKTGPRYEIRVYGAFDVKDQLKNLGYRFEKADRYWARDVPADGFSFAALVGQPWVGGVANIHVCDSSTGELRFSHPRSSA